MNSIYTIHLPALDKIVTELQERRAAIQVMLEGKLPITLVTPQKSQEILDNAQNQLAEHDTQLAVTDIKLLYSMKIVTANEWDEICICH